jgi:hypothetical protein
VCKNRERSEFWVSVLVRRDISQGGYFYRSFLYLLGPVRQTHPQN